jgi:hypothetical protein
MEISLEVEEVTWWMVSSFHLWSETAPRVSRLDFLSFLLSNNFFVTRLLSAVCQKGVGARGGCCSFGQISSCRLAR